MKLRSLLFASALAAASTIAAHAVPIDYFTDSVKTTDPTQLGRLSRNNIPQTWAGAEPYPGLVNTATTYHYRTYTYDSSNFTTTPYVELSIFDENDATTFFLSAYANSYDPKNKAANWLGDAGTSGLYFGTDALSFDVKLPVGDSLVLLVNTTGGGNLGTGQPYDIAVNAYADTQYDDTLPVAATPEPGSLVLTLSGVLGMAGVARRRFFAA